MKCFCGKEATNHTKVKDAGNYRYADHPRCEECKERALRSYDDVEVKELKERVE